ncbi:MAG: SMC-Scp complex subunit ScpB [Cyanobacteriota bacterium]
MATSASGPGAAAIDAAAAGGDDGFPVSGAVRLDPSLAEQLSLPAQMEAILYLKGRPLSLGELAEIAAISREQAELALITLMADYAHRDTALEIRQEGSRYSLQLRASLGSLVQNLVPVDLSTATLRTLATIALKKRILQSELVDLRGSGAYDHIKELLAQDFIERKRQSDGRSYWLTLSEKFHRTFAIEAEAIRPPRSRAKAAGTAEQAVLDVAQPPAEAAPAPSPAPAAGATTGDDDWEQAA